MLTNPLPTRDTQTRTRADKLLLFTPSVYSHTFNSFLHLMIVFRLCVDYLSLKSQPLIVSTCRHPLGLSYLFEPLRFTSRLLPTKLS